MNLYAQLGNRELTNRNEPVLAVKDFTLVPFENVSFIESSGLHNCLQQDNGDIWCWGANGNGQLGFDKDWRDYPSCDDSNCRDAKEIQPVNITLLSTQDPDRSTFSSVDSLVLGGHHTVALKGSDLYFWGENSFNQLSIEQLDNQLVPPELPQLTGYTDIQLGGSQSCGIMGGILYCWGRNLFGELGIFEKTYTPTEILNLSNITQYSLGVNHNCAIEGAKIKCWGSNVRGELGIDNQVTENSSVVVDVLGF
jgi:serine/threonine-protein kinase